MRRRHAEIENAIRASTVSGSISLRAVAANAAWLPVQVMAHNIWASRW